MKGFIRNMFIMTVAFFAVFMVKSITVNAAIAYNDYPSQTNVAPAKIWSIKFNNNVSLASAQSNITVYDSNNNIVSTTIYIGSQNNIVMVKPNSNYTLGKQYYMIIKSAISNNLSSKHLNNDVRMYFTIKTQLDPSDYQNGDYGGIPSVTGLVIVGKDRAYAVSYLLQHADIANDINGNTSKSVYYIPDPTKIYYAAVQNIFGNINTYYSMSYLHYLGYTNDTITYTDAIGNTYQYVWNSSNGYYMLKTPGVSVTVNLASTTGAISLTVNSVNAIPGAAYYKIDGTNITRKIGSTLVFTSIQPTQKIDILSSDQNEIGYGYINVSSAVTNAVFPITLEDNKPGNTNGNSNNNGSVVLGSDGYTYYLNSGDNNTIYKTDDTGNYNIQIGLDKSQYMNEQSGWIYYSNYSDNQKIYRIKADGSRREKVCDDSAAYLVVSGDWIYYSNHSQQGRLYKIGVSAGASNKDDIQPDPSTYVIDAVGVHGLPVDTIYSSQIVPYDEVTYLNVVGNWIYYVNNSDDHKIYKIDVDGNFRTKVNDEWSACPQVVDGEIYYCSKIGEIMKISTDGTSGAVDLGEQTDQSALDQSFHINVSGDWIYYSNKNDNDTLYEIKKDGSGEKHKLTDFPIYYVETAGNKLYIDSKTNIEYTLPVNTTGGDTPIPVGKTTQDNQIVKVNDITKVVDYQDVNKTIEWLEDKYLPDKVTAVMSDNTQQELTVSWDKVNKTYSNGIYTYTGTLVGYDKTVKLQLIIPSQMLNITNQVQIINNPGANDYIKISPNPASTPNDTEVRAKAGDIIRVYADDTKTIQLNKGVTIAKDGTAMVSIGDLYQYGNAIYITIQRNGKYESNPTKILQMNMPQITPADPSKTGNDTNPADFGAKDNDNVYLGATGADFTIYGWKEAEWDDTISSTTPISDVSEPTNGYDYMYVLPSASSLDIRSAVPVQVPTGVGNNQKINLVSGAHSDAITLSNDITVDSSSAKNKLTGGYYSIYIVRHYVLNDGKHDSDTFVTADPNGSRPVVTADISTEAPATEEVTSEGRPDQPIIAAPNKVNHELTKNVLATHGDILSLKKSLSSGEELWLVPTNSNLLSKITGWAAQTYATDPAYNTMDMFYGSIHGAEAGILTVSGSIKQNDFNVDDIDPSITDATKKEALADGVSYYAIVMNNVQASIQSTQYITADYDGPTVALSGGPTDNKYDATATTDPSKYLINIIYKDANGAYNGTPGTIYILPGNNIPSPTLTDMKMNNFMYKQVIPNWTATLNTSQFASGYYEIFAADDAGNISSNPITIYINNPNYTPTGPVNH